jgi:hypothetical protein
MMVVTMMVVTMMAVIMMAVTMMVVIIMIIMIIMIMMIMMMMMIATAMLDQLLAMTTIIAASVTRAAAHHLAEPTHALKATLWLLTQRLSFVLVIVPNPSVAISNELFATRVSLAAPRANLLTQ